MHIFSADKKVSMAVKTETEKIKWKEPEKCRDKDFTALHIYICNKCGAQFVGNKTEKKFFCPQCGNDSLSEDCWSHYPEPQMVIPFEVAKSEAINKYKRYVYDSKFISDSFAHDDCIKNVTGFYVPQWVFFGDGEADVQYISCCHKPDTEKKKLTAYCVEGYIDTDVFKVDGLPITGMKNSKHNNILNSLGTYDAEKAVPFKPEHLQCFYYQLNEIDGNEAVSRADRVINHYTTVYLKDHLFADRHYKRMLKDHSNVNVKNGTYHLVLFPIWVICVEISGRTLMYNVNGQKDKFKGISEKKSDKEKENGVILAIMFAYMLFFLVVSIIFFHEKGDLIYDLVGSVALGLLFGTINAVVTKIKSRKKRKKFNSSWIGGGIDAGKYLREYECNRTRKVLLSRFRWIRSSTLMSIIMLIRYRFTKCDVLARYEKKIKETKAEKQSEFND